jgi:hypothetical protein
VVFLARLGYNSNNNNNNNTNTNTNTSTNNIVDSHSSLSS